MCIHNIFKYLFQFTAYAAVIAPPGTSATVQGIVAGMDDGLGFAIGSFLGGFLFQTVGGKKSFQIYACLAFITCIAHILLRPTSTHEIRTAVKESSNDMKERQIEKDIEEEKLNIQST
jgi:predicted MFS family arabinose efflux permease